MNVDRNKTELTQNITRLVGLWLDDKGFKPVETEVPVAASWVADVAGVCTPTQTEIINLKLIPRPPRLAYWQLRENPELRAREETAMREWNAKRDAVPSLLTCLVEVKTSVGDFRGDRKWKLTPPANLCYVAMPQGMIDASEWPTGWGIILFDRCGNSVRKMFPPKINMVTVEQQLDITLSLAVRRDHQTRYARLREMDRQVRITQAERKSMVRVSNAIDFVLKLKEGQPLDRAKMLCGIRCELPDHLVRRLATINSQPMTATETKHAA